MMKKTVVVFLILFLMGNHLKAQKPFLTNDSLSINPSFIGLFANNFDTLFNWYTSVVGFKVIAKQADKGKQLKFAMLELDGQLIELIQNPKVLPTKALLQEHKNKIAVSGFFKLGFKVKNILYWEGRFKKAGLSFKYPLMSNPNLGWKLFILEDPEGNLIQFFSDNI